MATDGITLELPEAVIERLAERVSEKLEAKQGGSGSPWMNTKEAAEYLRCSPSRIRKLTMTGELPHEKDGSRNLYHRNQLYEFVLQGGASAP